MNDYRVMRGDPIDEFEDREILMQRRMIAESLSREVSSSVFVKMLLDNAEHQAMESLFALAVVDATDTKEIVRLQNNVARARDIGGWVQTILEAGDAAAEDLAVTGSAADYDD